MFPICSHFAKRVNWRLKGVAPGCLYQSISESWRPAACARVKDDSEIPSRFIWPAVFSC